MKVTEAPAFIITDVLGGGPALDGAYVVVEMLTEHNERLDLRLGISILEKLTFALQTFAAAAKRVRDQEAGGEDMAEEWTNTLYGEKYEATHIRFLFSEDGQTAILQASGPNGPPHNIVFPASDLRGLQTVCKRAAEQGRRLRAKAGH